MKHLFKQWNGDLLDFVKHLRILEYRLKQAHDTMDELDISGLFTADLGLHDLLSSDRPSHVAFALTIDDGKFTSRINLSQGDGRREAGGM